MQDDTTFAKLVAQYLRHKDLTPAKIEKILAKKTVSEKWELSILMLARATEKIHENEIIKEIYELLNQNGGRRIRAATRKLKRSRRVGSRRR